MMQQAYKLRTDENFIKIPASVGCLQGLTCLLNADLSPTKSSSYLALICHPHPLFQGTMFNKVVTTIARTCAELEIPSLRFNYRGIGESDGSYQELADACQDIEDICQWLQQQQAPQQILWFGFSFGSYIATYGTTLMPSKGLVTVAPSMERMPFATLNYPTCPWWIIQGEADEVVSPQAVYDWADNHGTPLIRLPECSHFFHGQLLTLSTELKKIIAQL